MLSYQKRNSRDPIVANKLYFGLNVGGFGGVKLAINQGLFFFKIYPLPFFVSKRDFFCKNICHLASELLTKKSKKKKKIP